MTQVRDVSHKNFQKHKMSPPEGGWGYIVTLAVSLVFIVGLGPLVAFGIIFGPFLSTLGDAVGSTALITGLYNAVSLFSGLPANYLLKKYSYRKVGLLGAVIFALGGFATVFATSINYMLITFGIIQGFGFGLLVPSCLSAFHEYFVLKQNFMMSIAQSIIGAVLLLWPAMTFKLIDLYGFRGTAAVFSAMGVNGILAMLSLQPAKWHFIRRELTTTEMETFTSVNKIELTTSPDNKADPSEIDSLMGEHNTQDGLSRTYVQEVIVSKSNDTKEGMWNSLVKQLDLGLFKEPQYVNLALGVAMALTSDVTFLTIIPLLLDSYGFGHAEHGLIMTTYFVGDLAGRIFLSVISGMFRITNRHVVLIGAILSVILRTAFTFNFSFLWTISVAAILGSTRSCIQIGFALVFAEKYGPRFTAALSLFMVVCGCTILLAGVLSGYVKSLTGSNIMVVHMLTVFYALCPIMWLTEMFITKIRRKADE